MRHTCEINTTIVSHMSIRSHTICLLFILVLLHDELGSSGFGLWQWCEQSGFRWHVRTFRCISVYPRLLVLLLVGEVHIHSASTTQLLQSFFRMRVQIASSITSLMAALPPYIQQFFDVAQPRAWLHVGALRCVVQCPFCICFRLSW